MGGARWLLVAAGKLPNREIWQPLVTSADKIIAVDGGGNICSANNIDFDLIIGDLDSLDQSSISNFDDGKIHELSSQSESDLVKALNWCAENNCNHVDVVGIEGGRTDHKLAAFASLFEAPEELSVELHLSDCIAFIAPSMRELPVMKGQKVAFFAIGGNVENLTLSGFEYELHDERLNFSSRAISNTAINDHPRVEYSPTSTGRLLAMIFY